MRRVLRALRSLSTLLSPGIRGKVFVLSLVLLAIPWIGYAYIRQIEQFQREGQERALMGTARAVATALHDRPQLFELSPQIVKPKAGDVGIFVPSLNAPIRLDGHADDWPRPDPVVTRVAAAQSALAPMHGASCSVTPQLGRYGQFLYALISVRDDRVIAHLSGAVMPNQVDHMRLAWTSPNSVFQRYLVALGADGKVPVYALDASAQGVLSPDGEIEAVVASEAGGYSLELRIPIARVGRKFSFEVVDIDERNGSVESTLGVAGTEREDQLLRIQIPETEIAQILRGLGHSTARIWVVDAERHVLAQTGSLRRAVAPPPPQPKYNSVLDRYWGAIKQATLRRAYDRMLKQPREDFIDDRAAADELRGTEVNAALEGNPMNRWRPSRDGGAVILSAAHPIWNGDRVAGLVLAEETTNEIMALRKQALEGLFNTTLAVFVLGAGSLLLFASRLSTRIRRLRDEAEDAVDSHGRVQRLIAGSSAGDEIGDLSRSFSSLLGKLSEHTKYLENMASRMSHELRTPIAVVRSSLDNLRLQPLPHDAKVYMDRAQGGLARLNSVVTSMSEAARLEHALQSAEKERFDLGEVVAGCVAGYSTVYLNHSFFRSKPPDVTMVEGAPELIAQLLDKLASNAVDFAPHGSTIEINLRRETDKAVLRVVNDGPLLPAAIADRLFDSMVSMRPDGAGGNAPHLGLGLYIVRLIAQFHGARVTARNRADQGGVEIELEMPMVARGVQG
jgi:two-component system, OmpR family, sensor histidine kinase ChvG